MSLIDPNIVIVGVVGVAGIVAAALPSILEAKDRAARRADAAELVDIALKFDFARDAIAGRESSGWTNPEVK